MRISFKSVITRLAETVVSVGLVVVFFSSVLALLNVLFPLGGNLRDLMGSSVLPATAHNAAGSKLEFSQPQDPELPVAVLQRKHREVKTRGSHAVAWRDVPKGADLFGSDGVQTYRRSTAVIKFDEGSRLTMGENSLIVLKRSETVPFSEGRRSYLEIMQGEMEGAITSDEKVPDRFVEVATPSGVARIQSRENWNEDVRFRMKVNEDRTSTIAVDQGSAEVWANGQHVVVGENQYARIDSSLSSSSLRELRRAPVATSPRNGASFMGRDLPPVVVLSWKAPDAGGSYRVQISRDDSFEDVLEDLVVNETTLRHGNLKPGTYYWRVRVLDDEISGAASQVRRFTVVRDAKLPSLEVTAPPGAVREAQWKVSGRTDRGIRVFVEGKEVAVRRDGTFSVVVDLDLGINVVVVEAIDSAGNVAYHSQNIHRKP